MRNRKDKIYSKSKLRFPITKTKLSFLKRNHKFEELSLEKIRIKC